ncbi:MAG: class I SAM-dependent methyltransferase [Candidatus Kapabacteria bacterium]|nr:class I SAM-dependent methyltransferase [Candidatus Kapabacteria bacterium]
MKRQTESFTPIRNSSGNTRLDRALFYARMILDLQIYTIYRDIRRFMAALAQVPRVHQATNGGQVRRAMLDVGCGDSPYRFLLDPSYSYHGIDIADAEKFGYDNNEITSFDGANIPFEADLFDAILCTEVLEHVYDYQALVNEMYRVLAPGGIALITVPWSARYHYLPHDYFRYTPSSLRNVFSAFSSIDIKPRGTVISVIANKTLVLVVGLLRQRLWRAIFSLPFVMSILPLLAMLLLVAHIGIALGKYSPVDPLGYTIIVQK